MVVFMRFLNCVRSTVHYQLTELFAETLTVNKAMFSVLIWISVILFVEWCPYSSSADTIWYAKSPSTYEVMRKKLETTTACYWIHVAMKFCYCVLWTSPLITIIAVPFSSVALSMYNVFFFSFFRHCRQRLWKYKSGKFIDIKRENVWNFNGYMQFLIRDMIDISQHKGN